MSLFKVQRIRSCVQCGNLLPLKCKGCVVHPERKPRIIELYDWPPILETAPCGCILIQCQAPGCTNKKWRYPKLHSKTGKAISKTICCSNKCAAAVANSYRPTSVPTPCSYCGKVKMVQPSTLKLRRDIFCNASEHYLWVKRKNFEEGQVKIAQAKENESLQMLHCPECKDYVVCKPKSKYGVHNSNTFTCPQGHVFSIESVVRKYLYNGSHTRSLGILAGKQNIRAKNNADLSARS